jgi:hypothetical protein
MSSPSHSPRREACEYLPYDGIAGKIKIPFPNSIQMGPLQGKKLHLGQRIGNPPAPSPWIPFCRLAGRRGKVLDFLTGF